MSRLEISFYMVLSIVLNLLILSGSKATIITNKCSAATKRAVAAKIGGVVDYTTRIGKEQKIAMEVALEDYINNFDSSASACSKLDLHIKDSQGNPARAAATGTIYIFIYILYMYSSTSFHAYIDFFLLLYIFLVLYPSRILFLLI